MKKAFTISSLLFSSVIFAQEIKETEVPQPVKDSFAKLYPQVKKAEWEKDSINYEAEFKNNGVETEVLLAPDGKLIQTEVEVKIDQLPQAVKDYVAKNCSGKKIKEAAKITSADNTVMWEAEVGDVDYYFDKSGKFLYTQK
ncbi:MAG: hypothetical protein Fur0041_18910 [Bacteroidia bacterium]